MLVDRVFALRVKILPHQTHNFERTYPRRLGEWKNKECFSDFLISQSIREIDCQRTTWWVVAMSLRVLRITISDALRGLLQNDVVEDVPVYNNNASYIACSRSFYIIFRASSVCRCFSCLFNGTTKWTLCMYKLWIGDTTFYAHLYFFSVRNKKNLFTLYRYWVYSWNKIQRSTYLSLIFYDIN